MSQQLIVVGFKNDRYKAAEVLHKLKKMQRDWAVQLNNAVAVHRKPNGKLRVDQNYELTTGEGAGWGAIWGSILGAILAIWTAGLAVPAVVATAVGAGLAGGGALGAATGALSADWSNEGFGLSEDFIREVAATLEPGDSAVFALLNADYPDEVVTHFAGYGGRVLKTSLSDEQKARIESVLNQGRATH